VVDEEEEEEEEEEAVAVGRCPFCFQSSTWKSTTRRSWTCLKILATVTSQRATVSHMAVTASTWVDSRHSAALALCPATAKGMVGVRPTEAVEVV
jgi:hypothetical protein